MMLLSGWEHNLESNRVVSAGIVLGSKLREVVNNDEPRSASRFVFFSLKMSQLGDSNRSDAPQKSPE